MYLTRPVGLIELVYKDKFDVFQQSVQLLEQVMDLYCLEGIGNKENKNLKYEPIPVMMQLGTGEVIIPL